MKILITIVTNTKRYFFNLDKSLTNMFHLRNQMKLKRKDTLRMENLIANIFACKDRDG